jgi:hypothetical protein
MRRLKEAWTIGLNPNAHRLLRHAIDQGVLALADALEVSQAATSRPSAENLATRLEGAGLLARTPDKHVAFVATPLGEAVADFVAVHVGGVTAPTANRSTILLLDDDERAELEESGFELTTALRRAAVEVAALRR